MTLIHSKSCNSRRGPQYPCDCSPRDNTPKPATLAKLQARVKALENGLRDCANELEKWLAHESEMGPVNKARALLSEREG